MAHQSSPSVPSNNDNNNNNKSTTGLRLTKDRSNDPQRQRKIRKRHVLPHLDFDFLVPGSFRAKVTRNWMVLTSLRALLIHVLYARGVVPTLVFEMLRMHKELSSTTTSSTSNNNNTSSMIPREHRSMFKCGTMLSQLLQQWEDLMSSDFAHHIGAVLISLGQSWSRQREQYVLQVNGLGQDEEGQVPPSPPSVQQEHTASRRFVSALMNATNENEDPSIGDFMAKPALGASSYQAQLSFWVSTKDAEAMFDSLQSDDEKKWIVRHKFRVVPDDPPTTNTATMRSNRPALIQARVVTATATSTTPKWEEGTGIWLTLPTVVKGFRLSR